VIIPPEARPRFETERRLGRLSLVRRLAAALAVEARRRVENGR
jgi:hypothetical protein